MDYPVADHMISNALSLAEEHLRAEGRIVPMFYFSGPGGEAVLRLDLTPESEKGELFDKAGLMATALATEACAWVSEARLVTGDGVRPVVMILVESQAGSTMVLAELNDLELRRIDSPLEATAGSDGPTALAAYLRRDDVDAAEAWSRLEAMGVNRSDSRRALN